MSDLKNPNPTRDIELLQNSFGNWLFVLREGDKNLYDSAPYTSYEECLEEGIRYLDELHEVKPLLCNGKNFGGYYEQV